MNQNPLRYRWTFDLPSPAKECIHGAILLDNQRYTVAPCHTGPMTATIRRVGEAGGQYLYELQCVCEQVIRTDGGMLPAEIA